MTTFLVCLLIVFVLGTAGCYAFGVKGWLCGVCLGVFMSLAGTTPGGLIIGVICLIAAGLAITAHFENKDLKIKRQKAEVILEAAKWDCDVTEAFYVNFLHCIKCYKFWITVAGEYDHPEWQERGKELYLKAIDGVIKLLKVGDAEKHMAFWMELRNAAADCDTSKPPREEKFYTLSEFEKHFAVSSMYNALDSKLRGI